MWRSSIVAHVHVYTSTFMRMYLQHMQVLQTVCSVTLLSTIHVYTTHIRTIHSHITHFQHTIISLTMVFEPSSKVFPYSAHPLKPGGPSIVSCVCVCVCLFIAMAPSHTR